MAGKRNSPVLYDLIAPSQVLPFFGLLVLVVGFDYLWNLSILSAVLFVTKKCKKLRWKFIFSICIFVTIAGAAVDLLSIDIVNKVFDLLHRYNHTDLLTLIYSDILLSMPLLAIINCFIGKRVFKLSLRESVFLGIAMGVLTAPWSLFLFNH